MMTATEENTTGEAGLLEISGLSLAVDGGDYFPDSSFFLRHNRGYLITGPDEEANIELLNILGGIYAPLPPLSSRCYRCPRVLFRGIDLYDGSERELKEARKYIAFVFRDGTMISNLNIKENLLLPFQYHFPAKEFSNALEKIETDFKFFGIPAILDKRPDLVSYGIKKKLAFIRAALQEPDVLLVEKPMFNLDEEDRDQVVLYLEHLKKTGTSLVIASRSQAVLDSLIDEAILLEKGKGPAFITRDHPDFARLSRFIFLR